MALCFGCMKENNGEQICPHCGFDRNTEQSVPYLPLGTKLQDENYIVGKKISSNAEGAKYIAYSNTMHSPVIISEFMPAGIGGRSKSKNTVIVKSDYEKQYAQLHEDFLKYYRNIARFRDLKAISPIFDIFSENNTSYVVGEAYEFIPFTEYLERRGGSIEWGVARPLFMPLVSALSSLHEAETGHYAIAPSNLVVTADGKLRLKSFAIGEIRKTGGFFEPELITGCAAPEQYRENGVIDEATDVYGLTATLFYALTGTLPENGSTRKPDGKLAIPTAIFKKLPPHIVKALSKGLQVNKTDRIQTFEELRTQLSAAPAVKAIQNEANRNEMKKQTVQRYAPRKREGIPGYVWGITGVLAIMLILLVVGTYWLQTNPEMLTKIFGNNDDIQTSLSETSDDNPYLVKIPNLIGKNYDDIAAMQNADSEYVVIKANEEIFSDQAEGTIVNQSPVAGISAEKGVKVVVTVSMGQNNRELPAISGQSLEAAVEALGQQGFIASGTYVASDTVEEGKVIGYENYNAGDMAPYGSKIVISISQGPETSN